MLAYAQMRGLPYNQGFAIQPGVEGNGGRGLLRKGAGAGCARWRGAERTDGVVKEDVLLQGSCLPSAQLYEVAWEDKPCVESNEGDSCRKCRWLVSIIKVPAHQATS